MDHLQKNAGPPEIDRRAFLRLGTLGIAGAAFAASACSISIQIGRSSPSATATQQPQIVEDPAVTRWKHQVKYLIAALFSEPDAWRMGGLVDASPVVYRTHPVGFHSSYSEPIYLLSPIETLETRYPGSHFAVNRLPYLDMTPLYGEARDVNAAEINRLADRSNIARFDCVPAPASARRPMQPNEQKSLPRIAGENAVDLKDVKVEYVRKYARTGGKPVWGVGVTRYDHRTGAVAPDLLLTSRDIG